MRWRNVAWIKFIDTLKILVSINDRSEKHLPNFLKRRFQKPKLFKVAPNNLFGLTQPEKLDVEVLNVAETLVRLPPQKRRLYLSILDLLLGNEVIRILTLGLQRTLDRLQGFEKQFNMSSHDFQERFNHGQIGDDLDLIEWAGEVKTYSLLKAQLQTFHPIDQKMDNHI